MYVKKCYYKNSPQRLSFTQILLKLLQQILLKLLQSIVKTGGQVDWILEFGINYLYNALQSFKLLNSLVTLRNVGSKKPHSLVLLNAITPITTLRK